MFYTSSKKTTTLIYMTTTLTNEISNLTKVQKEVFESLVKLGDSQELALKTAQNKKEVTGEERAFYENSYLN